MGRSPDCKAAFLNTLGANAEFYGKFAGNARAWHKRGQEAVLYLNHALVNPPIDYDEDGWTDPDYSNGEDVSIVGKPL